MGQGQVSITNLVGADAIGDGATFKSENVEGNVEIDNGDDIRNNTG